MSRVVDPVLELFCLARLGGVLLIAGAANAAELYEGAIGKPLKAAIEEFPGGSMTYSARPNRPLYELHGWRGLSFLQFDTVVGKDGSTIHEQF